MAFSSVKTKPQVLGMCERCLVLAAQTRHITSILVNWATVEKDALLVDVKSDGSFQ